MRRLLPLMSLLLTGSGCVTIYQPVTALQRPATIDPGLKNFDGLHMLVRCIPSGDAADPGESEDLCNNMQTLYSNQGAQVEIEIPDEDGGGVNRGEATERGEEKPDLIIELKARRIHSENSPILWILCYASLTLIPAITEATFAQDVVIRDGDGFLLVSDSLQARFIRYFGLGYWAVNGLLDLIVRPKGEGLIGNNHKTDFSRDFHGQMSQLAFHAQMRSKILKSFDPENEKPAATPAAPAAGPKQPGKPFVPQPFESPAPAPSKKGTPSAPPPPPVTK